MWAGPREAKVVAERLLAVLAEPYELPSGTVFLSTSIGLAGCATSVAWEPAQSFCVLQKRGGGSWECVTSLFDFPALKLP